MVSGEVLQLSRIQGCRGGRGGVVVFYIQNYVKREFRLQKIYKYNCSKRYGLRGQRTICVCQRQRVRRVGSVLTARGGPLPARTCRAGTRLRRFLPFCFSFCFCFLPLFEFSLFRLRYQLTKNRIPDIGMNEVFYDWFFFEKNKQSPHNPISSCDLLYNFLCNYINIAVILLSFL